MTQPMTLVLLIKLLHEEELLRLRKRAEMQIQDSPERDKLIEELTNELLVREQIDALLAHQQ
jgi:hypothetical protein